MAAWGAGIVWNDCVDKQPSNGIITTYRECIIEGDLVVSRFVISQCCMPLPHFRSSLAPLDVFNEIASIVFTKSDPSPQDKSMHPDEGHSSRHLRRNLI